MTKATHILAFVVGCFAGTFALAINYANSSFRTCCNADANGAFHCTRCGSSTDYRPKAPFRFCPICGAFVMGRDEL